jgi:centrosomal protein CEP95
MRKDIEHMQRVQDLKRKQNVENALKYKAKEQRFQNVKVKNYFEEFRLQQRAKMLKKLTKEEVLFKQLFNESLKIQKERVREMKKYAKEQRDIKTKQQMNQIESIENFYKNKFNLLNEKIKKEKVDNEIREKSQHEILTKMKSQMKNKLESDIRDLQSQLCNDEDFMYWRKLDANRVENDLKCARYKATV